MITTLLEFITRISGVLYALCGVGIFFSIRSLTQARRARRVAAFGLEREAARNQRRRGVNAMISLFLIAGGVYVLTTIVAPNVTEPAPEPTVTPVVFVTQQPTETPALLLYPTVTATVGLPPAAGETGVTPAGEPVDGCSIIGSTITNPVPGQTVSGQVIVEGEANILNFFQYKFEIRGPATGDVWVVVGTSNTPIISGLLGSWDSTSLLPGSYVLRLVVSDADGNYPTPCEVPIIIASTGAGVPAAPPTVAP